MRKFGPSKKSKLEYQKVLKQFDFEAFEAIALSQSSSGIFSKPTVGRGTHVFARMCARSVSILNASPKSRWSKSWYPNYDLASIASHTRALLEGYMLLSYLLKAPLDEDTQRAYTTLLHLYDCSKRQKIFPHVLPDTEIDWFKQEAARLKMVLEQTAFFGNLTKREKKAALSGSHLMFITSLEAADAVGFDRKEYEFYWNYLSQYTHIFSLQFYRLEPNSRGTGIENEFDLDAMKMALTFCAMILERSSNLMIETFPDTAPARRGLWSQFRPGPLRNSVASRFLKHVK